MRGFPTTVLTALPPPCRAGAAALGRVLLAATLLLPATDGRASAEAGGTAATTDAAAGPGRPRVLCLGDSLTEGYEVAPEEAWPALVEASLRASGWPTLEMVNAGVSGSTSASAVSRLKWQMRVKPDVLVLALGANDGLRGVDLAETRRNLAAAIDSATAGGVRVLLAGMMLPPNYGETYTTTFRDMFRDLAAEKNVALLPFLLEGVAADPSKNLPDGIHPNAAGYRIVAATVERHLRPLLDSMPQERAP